MLEDDTIGEKTKLKNPLGLTDSDIFGPIDTKIKKKED